MRIALGDAPATAPAPADSSQCPPVPAGYWVNPKNCTQFLPPDQGAQVGNVCFFGTAIFPGRLTCGGNGPNTKLYCGPLLGSTQMDSILLLGGAAALAWFLVPAPYKYWAALPLATLAALGAAKGAL